MYSSWLGRHPRWPWLAFVLLLVLVDQGSKAWFAATIPLCTGIEFTSWLNLVHVLNTGAAFSLLADASGWQRYFFIAVGLLVVVPVSFVCLTGHAEPMERWIGALVVAGAAAIWLTAYRTVRWWIVWTFTGASCTGPLSTWPTSSS